MTPFRLLFFSTLAGIFFSWAVISEGFGFTLAFLALSAVAVYGALARPER